MHYKLLKDLMTSQIYGVLRTNSDGTHTSFIMDENNYDYQEYLKWLAEGNTPEPADE